MPSEYVTNIKPNIMKNNIKGKMTKNQEISLYPALQIEFKINVQNKI